MNTSIQKQNIQVQIFILGVGIILFVLKFIAYFFTNSVLILSDAMESIVNLIAGAIGLFSLYYSSVPRDNTHPYGHGKIEFLTSGIEGALVFFAGLTIIYESFRSFFYTNNLQDLDFGFYLITVTGLINAITGYWAKKVGSKHRNLQLVSTGQHLLTDAFSTFAVAIGVIIIHWTGWMLVDALLGISVGLYILFPAYRIIKQAIAGIMDESDEVLIHQFIQLIKKNKKDTWIDLHNLKILKNGSIIHVDCHLVLPFYWTIEQATHEIQAIEKLIKMEFGDLAECSLQIEACSEKHCPFCNMNDCHARKKPKDVNLSWNEHHITELH